MNTSLQATLRTAVAQGQTRWAQVSPREQRLVRAALALIALALVWWVALGPALATLRSAQSQGPQLRAQLQDMLRLQAQAQMLQALPAAQAQDNKSELEAALPTLGNAARMSMTGDRATVTLEGSSADALAQWLTQARLNAHARPLELRLSQSQGLWKGSIVLQVATPSAP
jgi:general secretion pathway protein M